MRFEIVTFFKNQLSGNANCHYLDVKLYYNFAR